MNLDEKINRSIDRKLGEMAQLFNDADDAGDCLRLLRKLIDQIPLLEDIKTEIKQLQDGQNVNADQEPEDDPKSDPPTSDPEVHDLRKSIRDAIDGIDKAKRLSSPIRKALPSPDDPIPDWVKDTPWYDIASDIYKIYRLFKLSKEMKEQYGTIFTQLKELFDGAKTFEEFWKQQEEESFRALDEAIDIMNTDLEDEIARLFQIGNDTSRKLDQCCTNMGQTMSDAREENLESDAQIVSQMVNLTNQRGFL